jgi:hypothetical protein
MQTGRGRVDAEDISIRWTPICPRRSGLGCGSSWEINGVYYASAGSDVRYSASQQIGAAKELVFFHHPEFIFNSMIICNIYHSAVRKIGL